MGTCSYLGGAIQSQIQSIQRHGKFSNKISNNALFDEILTEIIASANLPLFLIPLSLIPLSHPLPQVPKVLKVLKDLKDLKRPYPP